LQSGPKEKKAHLSIAFEKSVVIESGTHDQAR
jgi:hypothetical protein